MSIARPLAPIVTDAAGPAPARLGRSEAAVIAALLASTFVVVLSETTMGVATPVLMRELTITVEAAQWLTTGFMLTMAIVIPITGYLLRRFPVRPVYFTAMGLFLAGTAVAAIAPGFAMLMIGRVLQAIGTAIVLPLILVGVANLVPPSIRGRVLGLVTIVMAVAPTLGPSASGAVLDALGWRWLFWLTLPLGVAVTVASIILLRNFTTVQRSSLDVLSVLLSALGFGGLVLGATGIGSGSTMGVVPSWVAAVVGIVALVAFVWRQIVLQRAGAALLDLRVFRSPLFATATALLAVAMVALFGALLILPLFYQQVLHLSAAVTGLLLLPAGIAIGLFAPIAGRLSDRFGPGTVVPIGASIVAAALWVLFATSSHAPALWVAGMHLVLGVGIAFLTTPVFSTALGAVPVAFASHASAILNTVQQVAGAVGTATLVTVMAAVSATSGTAAGTAAAFGAAAIIASVGVIVAVAVATLSKRRASIE